MAVASILTLMVAIVLAISLGPRGNSKSKRFFLAKTMLVSWAFGAILVLGKILSPNRGFPEFRHISSLGDLAAVILMTPVAGLFVGLFFTPAVGFVIWLFEKFARSRLQHWRLAAILLAIGLSVIVGMSVGWASGIFVDPTQSENPFAFLMDPEVLAVILVAAGIASGSVYALMSRNPIDA
ncbi:hypothetical protein WJS89_04665 [Sphingomicrobium sp. XHP0235]|uniref:hypothetical protein n=1 Tax=Sphingomicrobium aquimarinum TaxID=3133971 RepID=UPI0031FEEEB7